MAIYFAQEGSAPDGDARVSTGPVNDWGLIKIGHAANSVRERVLVAARTARRAMTIVGTIEDSAVDERTVHDRFRGARVAAPWSGREWFAPTRELIDFIRSIPPCASLAVVSLGARSLRERLGIGRCATQVSLARDLGVSQQSVSAWLRGIAKPDDKRRHRIAQLVGVAAETWDAPS